MSFIQKTDRSSRRIRRSHRESIGTSYHVYCINFYDSGLTAVCNEFIHRIKLGMRRSLFVIDLPSEIQSAEAHNEKTLRLSKTKKLGRLELKTTDPFTITKQRIQECLAEYDQVTAKIEAENNFNLYQYWLKNIPADLKNRLSEMTKRKTKTSGTETKRGGGSITGGRVSKTARRQLGKENADAMPMAKIECMSMTAKEHNKVGKGEPLARKLYIKDHPASSKLIIMIVGNFDNEFYTELLRDNQPLRGIVHFLPEESAYDLLVPRPRREKALKETIEKIQHDIHSLRKRTATKPVGIFQQQLPQMSMCLATKYSNEIFDQLSWYIYDVETLRQQYLDYYVAPYEEIDVRMDPSENIQDTFHMVESLSIQGHYLKAQMPASCADDGTVYLYLESLMSTFGNPRELLSEVEVLLLANPSPAIQVKILDKIKVYANAFKSIVKLVKNERLFVEHSNTLLTSIVSYMNQSFMKNIYHACLEYNLLRRYFNTGYIIDSLPYKPYNNDIDPSKLPKYAKLYLTDDSVSQRIIELVNEYEDFTVREIYPSVKLYTFRRALNEVIENQKQHYIPTRLCFRDFTLFEMEQFLQELVTPKMFAENLDERSETLDLMSVATIAGNVDHEPMQYRLKDGQNISIDPSVFIRPQSLKAQKMAQLQKEQKEQKDQKEPEPQQPRGKPNRKNQTTDSEIRLQQKQSKVSLVVNDSATRSVGKEETKRHSYIGLGPDHPMLKGYNLDDTRQTIKAKTSKFFFHEGCISLYEEKWNFRQMNKCLSFQLNKQTVHFKDSPDSVGRTSDSVRIETPYGIHLRVLANGGECSKAVLNYPNGLSVQCHDTYTEHIWSVPESELDESRRICTPHGCNIVFYSNADLTLIMRYNGEVYYLYNYLDADNNEEVEENSLENVNACSTYSTYSSYKPIPTEVKTKKRRIGRTDRNSGGTDLTGIEARSTQSITSKTAAAAAARRERESKSRKAQSLLKSIDCELKFLNSMKDIYSLSYRHLKIITSLGSVVHLQDDGKIWCGKPFQNAEWHDYCANESYAMRDDGLKMIWTASEMRCYHSDGSVIKTRLEEGWDKGVLFDEMDHEITSSSSHVSAKTKSSPSSSVGLQKKNTNTTYFKELFAQKLNLNVTTSNSFQKVSPYVSEDVETEADIDRDAAYITYMPNNYDMQHHIYAGIQFIFTHISDNNLKVETTVNIPDNLQLRIYKEPVAEKTIDGVLLNCPEPEPFSSEADADEWVKPKKHSAQSRRIKMETSENLTEMTVYQIDGNNMKLKINKDCALINTVLRKFGCDANTILVNDSIELKLNFSQSLSNAFRNWVEELNSFINCFCPKWQTVHFLEATGIDCHKKGFELMKSIPSLGKYNFCAGNYFIDVEELETVHNRLRNNFDWYDKDMLKFPRFPLYKKTPNVVNFPMVLSTKIYVEVPKQLANVERIHKFIEPFDKIKFRKLKYRFNEAVLFHIYPRLRLLVQQEISKRSWRSHHLEQSRRRFLEQQRLSLYMAMLKHKVYPNYFQFKDHYHYHVRNIDFFEFMASKCSEKANPDQYKESKKSEEEEDTFSEHSTVLKFKKNKKCYCPKYIKSMKK
ncbi:uncharacterized protein Dwil_GK15038 [Drosophila willistoni]|uniref:Uncharacterized protein n=1 Tax=Drosophila willistoni TaxID=7260 RepID=B4MVL8_DROWI|nr:uncharacterized protein Dwil_GK15038 [Drosophila willistoni]